MGKNDKLRAMLRSTDLVAFIANRADGIHAALIHMRKMTKEEATNLLDAANITAKRLTHFTYDFEFGGINPADNQQET